MPDVEHVRNEAPSIRPGGDAGERTAVDPADDRSMLEKSHGVVPALTWAAPRRRQATDGRLLTTLIWADVPTSCEGLEPFEGREQRRAVARRRERPEHLEERVQRLG